MAKVLKTKRLVNASKRKLTAKQVKYFGTKAQRAALKRKRKAARNAGTSAGRSWSRALPKSKWPKHAKKHKTKKKGKGPSRKRNISEVITIPLAASGFNPGRKTVKKKKRRKPGSRAAKGRRPNPGTRKTKRRARRRNPGLRSVTGALTNALAIIGGAVGTRYATSFVLGGNNTGVIGYVGNLVAAVVLGYGAGAVSKRPDIGQMVTLGGITGLVLRVINDLTGIGRVVNLSLAGTGKGGDAGIGLIGPSSYYVPQIPSDASMLNFVTPAGVTAAIAASAGARGRGLSGLEANSYAGRMVRGVASA